MAQTWSISEAITRGQDVYDFVWPPDDDNPAWPYTGGWGDLNDSFFTSQPPFVNGFQTSLPGVSGISIGSTSTVPSVVVEQIEATSATSRKYIRRIVTVDHPITEDIPGGFFFTCMDCEQTLSPTTGESGHNRNTWVTGYPGSPFRYGMDLLDVGGIPIEPFGAHLVPMDVVTTNGVFIPPRLHLQLHLNGSRPTAKKRARQYNSLAHRLAVAGVEEVCGVFPVGGRNSINFLIGLSAFGGVVRTATFRIMGVRPCGGGGFSGRGTTAMQIWPPSGTLTVTTAPGGPLNWQVMLGQTGCDFMMVRASLDVIGGVSPFFWMYMTADD